MGSVASLLTVCQRMKGYFALTKNYLPTGNPGFAVIDPQIGEIPSAFKCRVHRMYLFDDAAKQKRLSLFGGCDEKSRNQYSKICREFDTKGVYISGAPPSFSAKCFLMSSDA